MEELKPCPFCGGKAEIIGYDDGLFQAVCRGCDGTQDNFFDSPEEAAESWNNRPIENELEAEKARLRFKPCHRVKTVDAKGRCTARATCPIYAELTKGGAE